MLTLLDLLRNFPSWGGKPVIIYRTGVRRFVYSYEQLYACSLRMNGWLASRGIGKGDMVLIWGPNSPWWAVAFWGCIARGAVVVPVDFMSGRERAESIAGLTGVRLVICSRFKPDYLEGYPAVFMEDLEHLLTEDAPLREIADISPDDAAQIIYTSGTTGNPKGVILTHRNLVTNLKQVNEHIPVVTREFNFLSLLPLSHMFEQMGGFLTPLYRGAAIVYPRTLKPSAIMEALHDEDIYAVIAVPRLLQLFKDTIEREFEVKHLGRIFRSTLVLAERLPSGYRKRLFYPVQRKFGKHFTLFVSGGAALEPDDFRFWNSMGFTVLEGYGLTECSPVLTANTMERQVPGSVGKAVPGSVLKIENGEILAKGDNIFTSYYRDEQTTKEAFTADGWFKSGDLGELDQEGNLYIKGRSKELIVTGSGINVHPDEIENLLNRTQGVREACVLGLDRGAGEEVHAVLLLNGSDRNADEIIMETNSRLDTLHRVTGFSIWPDPDFPKTTTMKIQKFKVKERLLEGRAVTAGISADPLVALIARVTGSPAGDISEESLLAVDLGLTSIGRLELVNYLEQEFRLDLEDSVIDQGTKVADLRMIIARRESVETRTRLRFWTNSPLARSIRKLCDSLIHRPLFRYFVILEVVGRENLTEVTSPVMFIANHISYFDYPAIMFALPDIWRYNTATAAWEEFFFPASASLPMKLWKRITYEYGTSVLNLFTLPQTGGFRRSLHFMGKLADQGINILLFPEGQRSTEDGRLMPFQQGLGLMISELCVPVVPIRISGMEKILPRGTTWPKRGKVTIAFGKPLYFKQESTAEVIEKTRKAVEGLQPGRH
jgi:long-chain acyl-CoA synthetase